MLLLPPFQEVRFSTNSSSTLALQRFNQRALITRGPTIDRSGDNCTIEGLDRAFCNGDWASLNFSFSVTNLPIHGSDHAPIILCTYKAGANRKRLFKFEKFWTLHEGCRSIIQASWDKHFECSPLFSITRKLRSTRHNLLRWSREGIGDLANRISSMRSLLTNLQQALDLNRDFV